MNTGILMASSLSITIVLLLLAALVLVAGCSGEKPVAGIPTNDTTATLSSMTIPVPTPSVAPVRTICPVPDNSSSWINISPIARIDRGGIIRINGTTNLPAGTHLLLSLSQGTFHPHCKCCYDDQLTADVVVRDERGCADMFSFWFDSSNFLPEEYIISAIDPDTTTQSPMMIVPLFANTTPLSVAAGNLSDSVSASTVLHVFQPPDVARGGILAIAGARNGTPYAIRYAIRDAYADAACEPRCEGAKFQGIVHATDPAGGTDPFVLRFSTEDMSPGRYVAVFQLICREEDTPVRVWFNVTEHATEGVR